MRLAQQFDLGTEKTTRTQRIIMRLVSWLVRRAFGRQLRDARTIYLRISPPNAEEAQ